ncbi:MAG TPA: UDP-N-acetylmuramoyl-L-alanine--D-glutamate ligase [Acidimicrobiia bacterium]|nr:UDP-N-acetylmuramoyl-L-alanine--D-glutamate ligase [Acidimicrobiia bacterium]
MSVLVLGAAVSGRAAATLLRALGEQVVVYDADASAVTGVDADAHYGGDWLPGLLDGVDLVVTSPGISPASPPLAAALASELPVWSELELAWRHLRSPLGAVTATNGKTTVTEAAAAMLVASGLDAVAAGNIGNPLCAEVGAGRDILVVEASSFQLAFIERFHAPAAVLLNVAPDHLDWHGTFDHYVASKQRILERQAPEDIVVYDHDDTGATAAVAVASARRVAVSGRQVTPDGFGREGSSLRLGDVVVPADELGRDDDVFLVDLAAAAALALHLGATADGIAGAARAYRPGRHRRQLIGEWAGVRWVDDSKATNPHAALASIRSFDSVVLIAGGRAKGLDLTPLAAEPGVRQLIGIGEAGTALVAASRGGRIAVDMAEAVRIAAEVAEPGDTVLLAPGAASFDMFASYAERGDAFARLAVETKGR